MKQRKLSNKPYFWVMIMNRVYNWLILPLFIYLSRGRNSVLDRLNISVVRLRSAIIDCKSSFVCADSTILKYTHHISDFFATYLLSENNLCCPNYPWFYNHRIFYFILWINGHPNSDIYYPLLILSYFNHC